MSQRARSPRLCVAIDGPAGAGKSTVAKLVADRMGYRYIDTGALYRAVTLAVLRAGVAPDASEAVAAVARKVEIALRPAAGGGEPRIWLDGEDVSESLRAPEVSASVSVIALNPAVRARLVAELQELALPGGVVMDGRDIGTVVLPDAEVKIFLTASLAERAARRQAELLEQGFAAPVEEVVRAIQERDRLDATRPIAPLVRAPDAVEIDSTGRTAADVAAEIVSLCLRRAGSCSTP
ncbi:MAG TPA: (d)CMP kinase [Limnochordia bacterium]